MPIVEPESFKAIGAVKFQINPHYLDANPAGHAGETREQRILEYIEANPRRWVAGLREGCMLRCEDGKLELIGRRPMRMFRKGVETFEVEPGGDLSFFIPIESGISFYESTDCGSGPYRRPFVRPGPSATTASQRRYSGSKDSEEHAAEALQLGLADRIVSFEEGVPGRPISVVLATPVDTIPLVGCRRRSTARAAGRW